MPVDYDEETLGGENGQGLIDTHCHLDFEPLSGRVAQVLSEARQTGVSQFVVPGVHPDGWDRMAALAAEHGAVFPAFGIHPMHAGLADEDILARLSARAPGGVAIGEIGLDPAYAVSPQIQERAFREQLRLAVRLGLPVLVHCRKEFQRTLDILRQEGARHVGGIMHAYSGSLEMAREFIRLGFAISVSGMVTRDNALRLRKVVHELPVQELVLESDAPDLTPLRYRGLPNQPAYLSETVRTVAQLKCIRVREAARATRARSLAVLGRMSQR